MMIWKSVTGDVSSSSIVPDRFSSEYVRIVTIGSRNRIRIGDVLQQRPDQLLVDVHRLRPLHAAAHLHALPDEVAAGWRRRRSRTAARRSRSRCRRSARRNTTSAPSARSRGCYALDVSPPARRSRRLPSIRRSSATGRCPRGSCASAAARAGPSRCVTTALRQLAAHVAAALAFDFVADDAVAAVGFDDARDARHAAERGGRVARRSRPPARTSSPSRAAARSGCRACRRRRRGPC